MGKKKGNTIIIMLIFVFLISSLLGCIIFVNQKSSQILKEFVTSNNFERELEIKAYQYAVTKEEYKELFYDEYNLIIYKLDPNIRFVIYESDNVIKIKKEGVI